MSTIRIEFLPHTRKAPIEVERAWLRYARLSGAQLTGTDLTGAWLTD